MAGIHFADLIAYLTLDDSDYNAKTNKARDTADAFGKSVTGFLERAGQRAFDALVSGAEKAVQAMGEAVQASSNLNEEINKSGVVFGSAAADVVKWSETSTEKMGVSQRAALQATGQFGALAKQMGDLPAAAAATSEQLVQVAADLASINNTTVEVQLERINSGLIGMSRPLRESNIFLTEQAVAQRAVALGLAASTDAVSESAKYHARLNIILEQSKYSMGDQARTVRDLAGAQRKLAAETEDGAAKLGNVFRPAVTAITNELVSVAPQMFGYATNIMDQFAAGIAAGIRALLPAIMVVRQLFAYWFAPGSPPRVLPDIDKWGAAAMGQFLSGFSSVDVKQAFDTVGSAIEGILRSRMAAGKSSETGLVSSIFGTQDAIRKAVAEFASAGSVSEATINRITRAAGEAGPGIGNLAKAYFSLQSATTAATRAQDDLNRITERYDAILDPLQGRLDSVRAEQQRLADQQRLIAAQNTLVNFDSTAAEKRAAQLEIEQISLEGQISTVADKKKAETDAAQSQLDGAKKQQDAAQKQLDAAQATIDQQVQHNNLIGEQRQLEKRLADEQQANAEKQQRLAEQLHQAQLQYTLGIETTQQKIATLKGELANTTAGSVEYYNILGQIKSLEKQAADEAQRDKDKVNSAQLDYNLSLADTAGKIAIWQQELAKATPGTAEYFNILTKIHDLNVSLAKENAKGGAGDIGASLGLPDPSKLPTLAPTPGGKSFAAAITEALGPIGEASAKVKALGDSISGLVKEAGLLVGIDFAGWLKSVQEATDPSPWDGYGIAVKSNAEISKKAADDLAVKMKKSADDTALTFRTLRSDFKVIADLMQGNWKQFWIDWNENLKLGNEAAERQYDANNANLLEKFQHWELEQGNAFRAWIAEHAKGLGQWLTDTSKAFGQWLTDTATAIDKAEAAFFKGGANLLGSFFDGLKSKWGELSAWFKSSLAGLTAQLPFSEPKDPTSPLRNLGKSGESMVNMIQGGINKASLSINPLANALLPSAATNNNTNHSTANNMSFNITINGARDTEAAKSGAVDGVKQALRAAGLL